MTSDEYTAQSKTTQTFQWAVKQCIPFMNDLKSHWSKKSSEVEGKTQTHTCFKGCGTCCHYGLISSSSIEAFGLLCAWLESGKSLEAAHEAGMLYVDRFKVATQKIGHIPFSKDAKKQFLNERIPCPIFISTAGIKSSDEDNNVDVRPLLAPYSGHCGLFEQRPIICGQFHSTEDPLLCRKIEPHGTEPEVIEMGEIAGHSLRDYERSLFGKSALGHLPLIFAALTTQEGLDAYLRVDKLAEVSVEEPHAQETQDFFFYAELLQTVGINISEADLLDLEKAQAEVGSNL